MPRLPPALLPLLEVAVTEPLCASIGVAPEKPPLGASSGLRVVMPHATNDAASATVTKSLLLNT
jgi:hypothetical protein